MPLTSLPDLDSLFTVLRAGNGVATVFDSSGVLQQVTSTKLRQDFSVGTPTGRFNGIPNSRLIGASLTGDVLPTGWTSVTAPTTGWLEAPNLTGIAEEDGIEYLDYRYQPPAGQSASFTLTLHSGADLVPAVAGSTWTASIYRRRLTSAAPTAGTNIRVGIRELDISGAVLTESFTENTINFVTFSFGRLAHTRTLTDANTRFVQMFVVLVAPAGGSSIRTRIGGPQLEQGNTATPLLRPAAGLIRQEWEVTGNTARGVLLEDGRVNYCPNPTQQGAVPGSPGTPPASTPIFTQNGIAVSVVRSTTEDGMPVVDYRVTGTASTWAYPFIGFMPLNAQGTMPVNPGQAVTGSVYLRLLAGSLAGLNTSLAISAYDESFTYIGQQNHAVSPNYNPLRFQRYAIRRSVAADSWRNFFYLTWAIGPGVTVDFTIRVGLPQFEQGARETSPILNAAGETAAVLTRGTDQVTYSAAPVVMRRSGQTLYAKVLLMAPEPKLRGILQVGTGGFPRVLLGVEPDGTVVAMRRSTTGGARIALGTATYGVPFTVRLSTDTVRIRASFNSGTEQSALGDGPSVSVASLGASMTLQGLFVGQDENREATGLNGYLQEFYISNLNAAEFTSLP